MLYPYTQMVLIIEQNSRDSYANASKYCNKMLETLDDWKTFHVYHRNRKSIKSIINCMLKHKSSQVAIMFQAKWDVLLLFQYFAPNSTEKVSALKNSKLLAKNIDQWDGDRILSVYIVMQSPIFLCKDIKASFGKEVSLIPSWRGRRR